jgi:hypothetical protein
MPRRRLHQFNERRPCYFCGASGPSTKEHASPKSFFDGTPCSSITVPACAQHNSDKSRSDLAIKAALVRGVEEVIWKGDRTDMPDALRRSIETMQEQYRRASGAITVAGADSASPLPQKLGRRSRIGSRDRRRHHSTPPCGDQILSPARLPSA